MSPDELLPVLVADLDDSEARDVLDAAAVAGGEVWVPLETAPVNTSAHILEVHAKGLEPFFYRAEPSGPPGPQGFPLRIRPMANAAPVVAKKLLIQRNFVRGRSSLKRFSLSASHTKDLSYMGPLPTEEAEDAQIGRALANGKLQIESLIGRGGVGAVYKARHRELKLAVAVKVLHESFQSDIDFCRRFYAEALAASRLDHPNITRVLDFGQEPDGQLYFAMEFLDGVELRAVLDKEGKLEAPRLATLMMQVCAGLSHAHARGIVHRDIKPENLVLVRTLDDDDQPVEIVKVCDFGIAVHRAAAAEADGFIAGTPEYMSPEQCRSDELDARSDVYACGVVLYELATGTLPFTAERPMQVLNKHQFAAPVPPSKIDPSIDPILEGIILKAIAKEPSARQQSMRELRAELRALLEALNDEAPASSVLHDVPSSHEMPAAQRSHMPEIPELGGRRASPPELIERPPAPAGPAVIQGPSAIVPAPPAQATAADNADALAANALAWNKRLATTTDPKAFAQGTQKLEGALRALAQKGEVDVLVQISSTMHRIASEGQPDVGSRAWSAIRLLRVFDDPATLAQIAELLLTGAAAKRDNARSLLMNAGVAGAYGLYGARVKLSKTPAVRPLFVITLKDFGPKAWPVVKASLEKIAATTNPNLATLDLTEDLLLGVPGIGDESAGNLVLKFLRWPHSNVCRAAAATILKLWGERAKPVFVAMVQSGGTSGGDTLSSEDDAARIAGLAGLRQLNAIDERLVPRLEAILTRKTPASEDLRTAAALALAHPGPEARGAALTLLTRLFTSPDLVPAPNLRQTNTGVSPDAASLSKEDRLVLAVARSLLTVGGKSYRTLVTERAERSQEPLRGKLRALTTPSPQSPS